jgi:hypothetical protein
MFIVTNDVMFHSVEGILEVYSKHGCWTQKHTDLIVKGLEKLAPGQRLELASNNFVVSGKDEEGHWSFNLPHPKVIQKVDETVNKLFNDRILLKVQVDDLNHRLAELTKERDKVQNLYNKSEGAMHKHANSVAPAIKV